MARTKPSTRGTRSHPIVLSDDEEPAAPSRLPPLQTLAWRRGFYPLSPRLIATPDRGRMDVAEMYTRMYSPGLLTYLGTSGETPTRSFIDHDLATGVDVSAGLSPLPAEAAWNDRPMHAWKRAADAATASARRAAAARARSFRAAILRDRRQLAAEVAQVHAARASAVRSTHDAGARARRLARHRDAQIARAMVRDVMGRNRAPISFDSPPHSD